MKKFLLTCSLILAATVVLSTPAQAVRHHRLAQQGAARFAQTFAWHANYAYTPYGQPVALVVPPTVNMQRAMGWGVTQSTMLPIYHQFGRPYPGAYTGGGVGVRTTPAWPSHTDQFGVYYIRGPW